MKNKSMIILALTIFVLITIAGVSAADTNDTAIASEDTGEIELSASDDLNATDSLAIDDSSQDTIVSGGFTGNFGELQNIIDDADKYDIIYLQKDYNGSGEITIDKELYIAGLGHSINAQGKSRIFDISSNVVLENITFLNGNGGNSNGGAIYSTSYLELYRCSFAYNVADMGGAVSSDDYTLVEDCLFYENHALTGGGAIYSYHLFVGKNSKFINNTADEYGGSIYGYDLEVVDSSFVSYDKMEFIDFYNNEKEDLELYLKNNTMYGVNSYYICHESPDPITSPVTLTFNTQTVQKGQEIEIATFEDDMGNSIRTDDLIEVQITDKNSKVADEFNLTFSDGYKYTCNLNDGAYTVNAVVSSSVATDVKVKKGTLTVSSQSEDYNYTQLKDQFRFDGDITLTAGNYTYVSGDGDTIEITTSKVIDGNGAVIDMANSGHRAFYVGTDGVTIKNLTIKNANFNGIGGAIYFTGSGTVENCNFTGNTATGSDSWGGAIRMNSGTVSNCNFTANQATIGGAVYFTGTGDVRNCNFTNNTATNGNGGAIRMYSGSVTNCNFTNNKATGDYSYGGAVYFNSDGDVRNCNFTNNTATNGNGGAIRMSSGSVTNCNFDNNTASEIGGAIWMSSGSVENCNFINNTASEIGGAIHMNSGSVTNCNFTGNTATNRNGGAVYLNQGTGSVSNCNFTDNSATLNGGAVYFNRCTGSVTNCNFTNNKATGTNSWGGAIMFVSTGEVINCNFTDNSAEYGGAIRFNGEGTVSNCNFTGNNATTGSAIYFYLESSNKIISNSIFLNNRANSEALEVLKNENNITITFTGNDNLLNAIYSPDDVSSTNVTYWGAHGIANTGSSSITPSRSNKEAGQNITVSIVINNEIVSNEVYVTDANGRIVLNRNVGDNYFIGVCHDTDSYYTEKINTASNNTKFNVNVTSQTTNNKTVNITAKSNILNEVMPGKLLFIVPNTDPINATYAGNGTWWAVYTFDDYTVYEVNATYTGLDNVTINNATITINKANSTLTVGDIEFDYNSSGSTTVSFDGASGVKASVVGHPDANVSVVGNTITVSGLNAGNYTLTVTTIADANHNNVTKTSTITVNKINSTLTVGDIQFDYNSTGSGSLSFTGASGVNASVVDQPNAVVNVNTDSITVSGLNAGNYTLTVTTIADANHNNVTKTANITVNKVDSTLTVGNVVFDYNKTGSATVSFTGANGVNASVVDHPEAVVNVDGNTITVSNLNAGNYTLTVTTKADANHNNVTKTANITVNKVDSTLTVDNVVLDYGKTTNITAITEGAEGITAKINNDDAAVNGNTIYIPSLDVGNYTLTVTTIADANHNNVTKTAKITVNKVDSTLTVGDIVFDYNSTGSATISYDGATGVNASVIDRPNAKVNVDGNTITVSNLNAGNYTLTVTTIADANHNNITKAANITANKIDSTLTVDNVVLDYGKTTNVTAVTEGATGVTAKIDNDDAVVNGNTIVIPSLDVGNYTLTVTTIADANHNNVTKTANITVNKVDSTLTVGDIVFDYNSSGSTKVSYNGAIGVNASVVGQPKAVVNVKDDIITVSGLDVGNYTLSVTTIADANHNNITKTSTITVNKIKTELTAAAITATYNIDKDLVITLNDSNGKALSGVNVTVDLNGVKKYTTDENGQVKVSTRGLAPQTYTANITFNDTDIYDKAAKDVNVTVKKATPKITAKAKTFKTTTKTKKYTITLKDNTGKAIKNAKVTLKVNGKTYTAKTNSKGKATFKITKLNKKGTYKATVTYKANKYYNKATKKVKITVKSTWKTVSKGSKDHSTVKKIQKALKANGYYLTYQGHYLMVDGIFESCTERSVKEFQSANGLKVTGKVDEKTAKKLKII